MGTQKGSGKIIWEKCGKVSINQQHGVCGFCKERRSQHYLIGWNIKRFGASARLDCKALVLNLYPLHLFLPELIPKMTDFWVYVCVSVWMCVWLFMRVSTKQKPFPKVCFCIQDPQPCAFFNVFLTHVTTLHQFQRKGGQLRDLDALLVWHSPLWAQFRSSIQQHIWDQRHCFPVLHTLSFLPCSISPITFSPMTFLCSLLGSQDLNNSHHDGGLDRVTDSGSE